MQEILSFAQKPAHSSTVRGIITFLDLTIYEVCVTVLSSSNDTCVVIDPQDCSEALIGVIRLGGEAARIECEFDEFHRCVQLHLMIDPTIIDSLIETGKFKAEEHMVNLARNVWREARIPSSKIHIHVDTCYRMPACWNPAYPLYAHQKQTVSWMEEMERRIPVTVTYAGNLRVTDTWYIDTESECFTTCASEREARLAGGICADGTGSGKTATMLHMVASTTRPQTPCSLETHGTLVIVPLNLISQWQNEVRKFIVEDMLNVIFLIQGKDLKLLNMQKLCEADLVVTTFQFLRACKAYTEMVETALEGRSRTRPVLSAWSRQLDRTEPIVEAIFWNRVVVDELHDTFESPRDLRQLKLFRMKTLWGLTATPVLDTEHAQNLYLLLLREKAHHPNLLSKLIGQSVKQHSELQTGVKVAAVSLELVHLSAEERVKLNMIGGDNKDVADIVRRCTFVEHTTATTSTLCQRETLSAKLEAHERSVRIMEATSKELDKEMERLVESCSRGDTTALAKVEYARRATELHARDLGAARLSRDAERMRLDRLDAADRLMQERLTVVLRDVCQQCGNTKKNHVLLRCCASMCCLDCLKGCNNCPFCAQMLSKENIVHVPEINGMNTKMNRIGKLVTELNEPVILFVQWKSMMRFARSFLRSIGVRVLLLDGNAAQRASTLTEFMSSGVLLICLEDSFAGLHLPHVKHIVFAHAIVGDRNQVEQLEKQAIARCVRHGQNEQVHIYSFVIIESEEERLWVRTHN